jgi:PilZ domain
MASDAHTRRWERHPVDFPIKIAVYRDADKVLIPGQVTELSEGGMTLYAGMSLQPGDLFEAEFELPTPRTIQAVVRTRDGFSFGVEFIQPLS